MVDRTHEKRIAAEAAVALVEPGMWLGLGTGSTATFFVDALAARMKDGLSISGTVPTSEKTRAQAEALGIPLVSLDDAPELDLTLDGADEISPNLELIKGGGGALLREKIVASASKRLVIIADASKEVDQLGRFLLPVEIIARARVPVTRKINALGGKATLRLAGNQPFVTDEGHAILDCDFGLIEDPPALARELSPIAGVVEHGLFIDMAEHVIIGVGDTVETRRRSA